MGVLPGFTKRAEAGLLETLAGSDDAVQQLRQQFVAHGPGDLFGHVRNGLIDVFGNRLRATNVDADADDHFHWLGGSHQFDQNAAELAPIDQHVVGPFQLHAFHADVQDRLAHRQPHHQTQRAEFGWRLFAAKTDGNRQVAPERAKPLAPAPPASGGLRFRGEYAAVDGHLGGPLQQSGVGAVDAFLDVKPLQPSRRLCGESGSDGRRGEQFDAVFAKAR